MEPIDTELFGIKHKTQAINSKLKGNRNELNLTHVLSAWAGREFTRVPRSGGLRWKNRESVCGDVIVTEGDFRFSIETKHVKNLGLKHSAPFIRKNSCIYRFMEQCKRDASATGKIPMLAVRDNGMPKEHYYIFLPVTFSQYCDFVSSVGVNYLGQDKTIVGFQSERFFEKVKYETLIRMYGDKD